MFSTLLVEVIRIVGFHITGALMPQRTSVGQARNHIGSFFLPKPLVGHTTGVVAAPRTSPRYGVERSGYWISGWAAARRSQGASNLVTGNSLSLSICKLGTRVLILLYCTRYFPSHPTEQGVKLDLTLLQSYKLCLSPSYIYTNINIKYI